MSEQDGIERILAAFRTAVEEIPASVRALDAEEICGEAANGSVRVFLSPLHRLLRVEIERGYPHSAGRRRLEGALLDAFHRAEAAADAARARFEDGLTFLGLPIGRLLHGAALGDMLPSLDGVDEALGEDLMDGYDVDGEALRSFRDNDLRRALGSIERLRGTLRGAAVPGDAYTTTSAGVAAARGHTRDLDDFDGWLVRLRDVLTDHVVRISLSTAAYGDAEGATTGAVRGVGAERA